MSRLQGIAPRFEDTSPRVLGESAASHGTARLAALLPGGPRVAQDARVEVQVDVWSRAVVASHPNQHRLSLCLLLLSDRTACPAPTSHQLQLPRCLWSHLLLWQPGFPTG